MVLDTGGVVAVVVCCVSPVPAPVAPAVEPPPVEAPLLEGVVVLVVELELDVLLGVVTVALPVVGTVSGGAPVVLVRLALLPLPQAAKDAPLLARARRPRPEP